MDQIGRIQVPSPVSSGLTFPLVSDFSYGTTRPLPTITHRFGELGTKATQVFQVGMGPRRFQFRRQVLSLANRTALLNFYEATQGSVQTFIYNAPNADKSTTAYTVIFETQPLSIDMLVNACRVGLTFIECPDPAAAPSYSITSTSQRYPSGALQSALLGQVQQIITLVHIKVRESGVPDIYLSDRRVTVGGQLYLPRLLNVGEPGSDVIVSQNINGQADVTRFTFGNADRVMTQLENNTDLKYAQVDMSLFHVGTGIVLQLWKGFIQTFDTDGSPQFSVQCSDGIFKIMQQHPSRVISRTCWKVFKDGINCPYVGAATSCDYTYANCLALGMQLYFGGMQIPQQAAIVHSGGNRVTATSIVSDAMWGKALPEIWCNQGLIGHVGAMNPDDLKAFWITPIMAVVRDEAQYVDALGIIGAGPIGGYTIIPGFSAEVQTNVDGLPVFIGPTVDGFPAQGWKGNATGTNQTNKTPSGLRQIVGTDPAPATPAIPTEANPSTVFGLTGTGGAEAGFTYAAGTAFVELRYPKSGTVQPSTPEQHTMQVPVAKGLTGWVWDASGTRTAVGGLTNPFWVCINTYLRAIGLANASSATQLQYFDLASLVNTNSWTDQNGNAYPGTGAAQIADLVVPDILGASTSTQFQFQGVIGEQKPLRDWLTEILNCALGYFTFQFGKLSLGCRINASAVEPFSRGNILYQSLRLTPIEASFERLVLSYADQDYQYQTNTAEYQDKDHSVYYGRSGAPLTARMNSVGCPKLNQALRVAITRTREEIGGCNKNNTFNNGTSVDASEWTGARMATWGSTILALNTYPGQVVSMTHPEMPGPQGTCTVSGGVCSGLLSAGGGAIALDNSIVNKSIMIGGVQCLVTAATVNGSGIVTSFTVSGSPSNGSGVKFQFITAAFRIQSWKLKKDWSIEIVGKTVTASMYNKDLGPKPADVAGLSLPVMPYAVPLGSWAPFQIQASATDALFPSEYTFGLGVSYPNDAAGNPAAAITVTGKFPVTAYAPNVGAPGITAGNITQSTTGGSIPGGTILRVSVCVQQPDVNGNVLLSPPSQVVLVQFPTTTNTNQFTLNGIVWPPVAGLTNAVVFISDHDDLICAVQTFALTAGANSTYTPTSVTCTGPFPRSTWALPNSNIKKVRVKGKLLLHGGPVGAPIDSVATNQIVASQAVDPTLTDDWSGRALQIIGRLPQNPPQYSFTDLASSNGTNAAPQVTSASHSFVAADVGGTLQVTAGTNWIADSYTIVSVSGGAATLNASCGSVAGLSGGSYSVTGIAMPISIPFWSANVTAFAPSTGTFTLDQDPVSAGILAGDVFVVCFKGYDNSANPLGFTDNGLVHRRAGMWRHRGAGAFTGGLLPSAEKGAVLRVTKGASRGMKAKVVDNTATGWIIDTPITIAVGDTWVIEEANWRDEADSTSMTNGIYNLPTSVVMPVANLAEYSVLIGGFTVDQDEIESPDGDGPVRPGYIYGMKGAASGTADGFFTDPIVANHVAIDLANGLNHKVILNQATQVTFDNPVWTGQSIVAGSWLTLYLFQDATGGRAVPAFGAAFASNAATFQIDGTPSTYTAYQFTFHSDNLWHFDSVMTGLT